MQLGMVGLGRMGANMVRRLMQAGHQCAVTDLNPAAIEGLAKEGATGAASLADLVKALSPPRAVWVMVPAGDPTEKTVMTLGDLLSPGDAIIDGGNSWFKDDVRRAKALMPKGVHYVDAGTSGGVWGAERGYCLMVGGPKEAVSRLEPIFSSLAPGESGIPNSRGRDGKASTAQLGIPPLRPVGRRPLRQDDPQRHRVRPDAGVRRRLRHPAPRRRRLGPGRSPLQLRSRRRRGALASRQRRRVVAAGSDGHRACRRPAPRHLHRLRSGLR